MSEVFGGGPAPSFWFFVIVGLMTLGVAARFAFRPLEKTLAVLRPLCAATAASAAAAFLAGVTNTLVALKRVMDASGTAAVPPLMVVGGACEATAILALGAAFLAVAWLLTAVGFHRQA
jgi:hypothetical protein